MAADLNLITTRNKPDCYICGAEGINLYTDMVDRLFQTPGKWNMKKCPHSGCGLVWIDCIPVKDDIYKLYLNYFTHQDLFNSNDDKILKSFLNYVKAGYLTLKYGYHQDTIGFMQKLTGILAYLDINRRSSLDFRVRYLKAREKGRLLEVGCGSGQILKELRELGWLVEGVDLDSRAVEIAKKNGLHVVSGFLEDQHYQDDTFDVIILSHLIEHVDDPLQLLKESYRILKSGGVIVIVTPNILSFGHYRYKSFWLHLDPPRHMHLFSPETLQRLLVQVSFKKRKVFTTIRLANELFIGSREFQRGNKFILGGEQKFSNRLWGHAMQRIEWLLHIFNENIGEEIVYIGTK